MNHKDKYKAKRFDTPIRSCAYTDAVYSEAVEDVDPVRGEMRRAKRSLDPQPPELKVFYGEVHGHTNFSDGKVDVDTYFQNLRDIAQLDFAALSDHDHGGVGKAPLWEGETPKWELIRDAVKRYYEKGKFTTLLAYERDSYPFYNNMVLYFRDDDAEMVRDVRDGEITEEALRALLLRDDVVFAPHDTYSFGSGTDFSLIDPSLMPPLFEIVSIGDAAEYMGNPAFTVRTYCEGGFYQDALRRGAKTGVIAGSDSHCGMGGIIIEERGYPKMYPGITGVWAKENSREAIFEALKAKRTYGFMLGKPEGEMRGRMEIDFRINAHYMGESITRDENGEIRIYFNVRSDVPVKTVTIVKNCRNYLVFGQERELVLDYKQEHATDSYYLRVELLDGRFGWTSPIWVEGNTSL